MFRKFALILTLFSLVACGPTPEQKEEKRVDRQHGLADSLNRMGPPRYTWSDAQLNEYESQLNALDRVDQGLNAPLIASLRAAVAGVRRARRSTAELDQLSGQISSKWTAFQAAHPDLDQATTDELRRASAELDEMLAIGDRILSYDLTPDSRARQRDATERLKNMREAIDHHRLELERLREGVRVPA